MNAENILDNIPSEITDEFFTTIHRAKSFRIEKIVSQGHCSPEGFWYDQNQHEWLIVLEGSAVVQFQDHPDPVDLCRGSYLNIPAHRRHRVVCTSQTQQTVWLAIHYAD